MTKDQTHIIRLLAKIQNECGKINFNTEHGEASLRYDCAGVIVSLNNRNLYANFFTHPIENKMIEKLESTLSEFKEYYRMNRIIVKKGES